MDDLLLNPLSVSFSTEIDVALSSSLPVITRLLNDPSTVDTKDAPVLAYLRGPPPKGPGPGPTAHKAGVVQFGGDISILDRARVNNWFELHVLNARATREIWMCRAPVAHALTVLLASRHRNQFVTDAKFPTESSADEQEYFVLNKAWEYQVQNVSSDWQVVDVDQESLHTLERRMFEVSKNAGCAGYYQWGLDVGDHKDCWFLYGSVPKEYNLRNGEYDDPDILNVHLLR